MKPAMTIEDWQKCVYMVSKSKGWHERPLCARPAIRDRSEYGDLIMEHEPQGVDIDRVLMKLALVHSEVSEAVEAVREGRFIPHEVDGKPEGLAVELADVIIRVMDTCEALGLDLEAAMRTKDTYNRDRPMRHGGKLA